MGIENSFEAPQIQQSPENCQENHAALQPGEKCGKCGYSVEEVMISRDSKKETMITYKDGEVDEITGPGSEEATELLGSKDKNNK